MSLIRILGLTLLLSLSSFAFAGADGDGVPDDSDNCPNISNADQLDTDSDGLGNVCDGDADGDGINYSGFKITNDDPLIGDWRLAGVGSLRVGSAPLDGSWFSIGAAVVLSRACQFDDVFRFNADGSFENVNGEDTWLESWQGGGDEGSCGASLEPHDGVTSAFWEYDVDAGALRLDGLGAYLGLPRVTNEGDLPSVAVPDSVSYKVETLSDDGAFMVVTIEAGNGVFWTFEFVRSNGLPIQTKPALFGGWKLAGEGSFRVGPTELDGGWFSPDASVVVERSCLMDDTYIFFPKGDFKNIQNGLTWLEDWQEVGGQAMCGAPVSPHDGNGSASYSYDSTSKLLRLDGVGAYLGIAKAVNAGELSKDVPVPESITYTVDRLAFDSSALTIFIEAGQGVFWTFDFIQISDNCPFVKNIDQLDFDSDGKGDPCDADDDNDGVEDTFDAFPLDATETFDTDNDGTGNNADTDDDGDGVPDTADGFALISLGALLDNDSDGFPDKCDEDCLAIGMTADSDDDNDGVEDASDVFPLDATETADSDNDGVGDNSDAFPDDAAESVDSDSDSVGDNADNCPSLANTDQLNTDGDTEGDACDSDDDNDGFSDDQEAIDGTNPKSRFSCKSGCFSFDIDENLEAQPLTDGLLVIRHLFGFSGDSLTSGAVSDGSSRGSSELISSYLTDADSQLDIDGDGESKPLTDGLLLIRFLFGFSGDSLISGAIGDGAERDTAEEVEAYIKERVPVQ